MRKSFVFIVASLLCLASVLWAQQTVNLTGPGFAQPGSVVSLSVNLGAVTAPPGPAAFEFQVSVSSPNDVTAISAQIGAAATAAMKQLACAPPGTTMNLHCIVYGPTNAIQIAAGAVATVNVTLAAATAGRTETFTLIQPEVDAAPDGSAITVMIGSSAAVVVPSACDVNGDGTVNSVDTLAIVSWVLGIASPPAGFHCDLNGDGKCDARDVELVAAAASGLPCTGH